MGIQHGERGILLGFLHIPVNRLKVIEVLGMVTQHVMNVLHGERGVIVDRSGFTMYLIFRNILLNGRLQQFVVCGIPVTHDHKGEGIPRFPSIPGIEEKLDDLIGDLGLHELKGARGVQRDTVGPSFHICRRSDHAERVSQRDVRTDQGGHLINFFFRCGGAVKGIDVFYDHLKCLLK